MAENDKRDAAALGDGRYKCLCDYIYDPEKGDPKHDIGDGIIKKGIAMTLAV